VTAARRRSAPPRRGGRLALIALTCLVLMGLPHAAALALTLVANPDSYSVTHDRSRTVAAPGVLANDVGFLGSPTAVLYSDVSHGALALRADGGFTYQPDDGFVGTDSFRYRAKDGLLFTLPATVTISVTNAVPVAVADHYTAKTGVQLSVPAPGVLVNDTDADGDTLKAELVDGGGNGSIDLDPDGSFTYKSGGSFVGDRTFTYRVSDGLRWSAAATVTITVGSATPTPTPTPPTPTPTPGPLPTVVVPLPSLPIPVPTIRVPDPTPIPTLPIPTIRPLPTATPAPTRSPAPSASAPDGSPDQTDDPAPSDGGGNGDNGGGPTVPGGPGGAGPVNVPPIDPATPIDGIGTIDIAGFDWVVPSLVLSVPGLLLILAVIAQSGAGLVAIPLVRRSLGGIGPVRRRTAPSTR
jgi:Big-like domain-containing protein